MRSKQVGFRVMLGKRHRSFISVFVNEHRRNAPPWGPPRIPECMDAPDPVSVRLHNQKDTIP